MNFHATRPKHTSRYVPVPPPKLCRGSLDTPALSLVSMGFCGHCNVRVYLNADGGAKRHYAVTGIRPNTRGERP